MNDVFVVEQAMLEILKPSTSLNLSEAEVTDAPTYSVKLAGIVLLTWCRELLTLDQEIRMNRRLTCS